MDTLRILIPIVVVHAVALFAIVIVVKRLLLNDTMRAVNRIRQVENEVRKKEEGIKREIEEHEKEFARQKSEAQEELQKQRSASELEVSRIKEQTIADARNEGDRIIQQAKKNEEKMRMQLVQEAEEKAVEYGGQIFSLVFSEKMTSELNKQFTNELLDALEEVDATSITVDGNDASFTTSHQMDDDQRGRLEKLIKDKFGVDIKVKETVQPDLLGGMIFRLGSLEIDGSLVSRYKEAVAEVKKSTG